MAVTAHFTLLPDREALAPRWRALEGRGKGSFFTGWTWVGAWLESYGVRPELLAVTDASEQDVALALVGHGMAPRLLGRTATLALNQSGDAGADRAFIEYNDLLVATGSEEEATCAALSAIDRRRDWRALRLSGIAPGSPLLSIPHRRAVRVDASPVYQVDLESVRTAQGDYLSLLSANSRSQIRRSMKDRGGDLPTVTRAASEGEVTAWVAEMQALNSGRHADNAWDDPAFRRFVTALALRGLGNGEVEMMRLTDGSGCVGLLVNFIYRGQAMNYQSAFVAPATAKDKPGLLCHAAAVGDFAARGMALYSLLAGKDRYKASLATCEESLEWWVLERFAPRLEIEALLRRLLRRPASA
jgi:CelD/BcsL family acetyltransferase involved in cellulose biosynthesis